MKTRNKVLKLGLTGGIGSGKSYVSAMLSECGIPVFDSDKEAKLLMAKSDTIISSIKELLGDGAYINGEINKPLMASYIFSSPENAGRINSIVHPCVKDEFLSWAEKKENEGHGIVAIESAILFESGFDSIVDRIIAIHAPLETRISRVMNRDNTTREKVIARINSQMDEDLKLSKSHFIIENDGVKPLEGQIEMIISALRSKR